jgi:hypothetical protein
MIVDPAQEHVVRNVEGAGGDRVDRDVLGRHLQRGGLGQPDNAAFGRRIEAVVGHAGH